MPSTAFYSRKKRLSTKIYGDSFSVRPKTIIEMYRNIKLCDTVKLSTVNACAHTYITNAYEEPKPEPETTSVHVQKFWREADSRTHAW